MCSLQSLLLIDLMCVCCETNVRTCQNSNESCKHGEHPPVLIYVSAGGLYFNFFFSKIIFQLFLEISTFSSKCMMKKKSSPSHFFFLMSGPNTPPYDTPVIQLH